MTLKTIILIAVVITSCLLFGRAGADDFKWKSSVGMMVFNGPKYEGANESQPFYMPCVDVDYGPFYASVSRGVGAYLPLNSSRTFILSPAIRWRAMRNLGESYDVMEYIGHIRPTATVNTILKLDPFVFNVRVTTGLLSDNRGATYNLGAAWKHDFGTQVNLSLYTTLIYGDRNYNRTYFGVTASQAARYGFAVHNASAGFKSVDVGGVVKYFITEHVALDFMIEYLRLIGAAAESPVVLDKNQLMVGIGATYHF